MKRLMNEIKEIFQSRVYVAGVLLCAICAYGFAVTHHSIGMDDTAIPLYFEDGLAPYVGRWCLFVLNKIFHISDFAPWMVEFISIIFLILSVILWCVLWRRMIEPKVTLPLWNYLFVAGIFLTCPLISEVFVFYLHNGICIGYGVCALALICLMESMAKKRGRKQRAGQLLLSAVMLFVALGFYESFIVVYVMGAITCFFLIRRLYGKKGENSAYETGILPWIGSGAIIVLGSMVLRGLILQLLKAVYHLEKMESYNVLYRSFFGDIFTVEGELVMTLKRFVMKYYVNAICYLPITVLVIALLIIAGYSLYCGIRQKDFLLPLCSVAMVVLPVLMSLVEGLATRYRSAQYVPLVGAFAVLLVVVELRLHRTPRWLYAVGSVFMGILIYNQCTDMNRWFYLDYLKYQNAKEVMNQIAYDLEKDYDTTKPIVFRGAYGVPYEITADAYLSFSSTEYQWVCRLTDWLDPHLKEKYFAENGKGYVFVETPVVSTLQWGVTAFDGTSQQLIEFWKMHGHDGFRCETDLNAIEEAETIREEENMPGYPGKGYIKECEDYIIVNFADACEG